MIPGGRIVCSLIVLTSIAAMEVAMPDPVITQQTIQVEHVRIEAAKPFADVKAALEDLVPPLDPGILGLLQRGETERARSELERLPALSIFDSRDHGALLRIAGQSRKAVQYEIGNPLTATSAPAQTDSTGRRLSLARIAVADLVQTKGLGWALCSTR
jgi:hypothetical protein